MKKKDIIDAIGDIDYDMVEDAEVKKKKSIGRRSIVSLVAAVVSLLLVLSVVIGLNIEDDPLVSPVTSTSDTSTSEGNTSVTDVWFTQAGDPSIIAPKVFSSFAEFEAYEKTHGEDASDCYYIPSVLGDDYELYKILRQEKNSTYNYEYIEVKYKLKGAEIDEGSLVDIRTKLISCEYSVKEYSDKAFENYIDNGFEAFEYNGRQIYKINNYTVDETTLLSYRVIFLEDGHLVGMFLPAIDTFENMMKYTDVIRVDIK